MASVEQLEASARTAALSGDRVGAARLWEQLLGLDPRHPQAANAVGMWYLSQGRATEAARLLQTANEADPGQPALLFNLAAARQGHGDTVGALDALKKALEADPYFVQAMFQMAVLLEGLGQEQPAATYYQNFIDVAPPEVQNDPRFAPMLERARAAVQKGHDRLERILVESVEPLSAVPKRAQEAVGALLGKHRTYVSEPTFFTVPRLPAVPFFDRELTPWLDELEAAAPTILDEAKKVVVEEAEQASRFVPYVANPPDIPSNQWADLNHSPKWGAFFFFKHGELNAENAERCPATMDLLSRMPLLKLEQRAPNAFFSLLSPETRIPPHTGVSNIRATVHLPLIVPPGCGFRVGPETREWRPGEAWVFDDTIEHEAWNESKQPRLILIFDVWNPYLTPEERDYYSAVMAAYDRHMGRVPRDTDIF